MINKINITTLTKILSFNIQIFVVLDEDEEVAIAVEEEAMEVVVLCSAMFASNKVTLPFYIFTSLIYNINILL